MFQVKQFVGQPDADKEINHWLAENPEVIIEHMSLAVTTDQGQATTVVLICYQFIEPPEALHRGPVKCQVDGVDPAVLFVQKLRQKLEAGDWYLDPMSSENIPARPEGAIMIGWEDELYLYLQSKTTNLVIKELVRDSRGRYFIGRNTLYQHLQEKGWLVSNPNQSSINVWVPALNTTARVLKILKSAIYPEESEPGEVINGPN